MAGEVRVIDEWVKPLPIWREDAFDVVVPQLGECR